MIFGAASCTHSFGTKKRRYVTPDANNATSNTPANTGAAFMAGLLLTKKWDGLGENL
jgi:hypothetical protein